MTDVEQVGFGRARFEEVDTGSFIGYQKGPGGEDNDTEPSFWVMKKGDHIEFWAHLESPGADSPYPKPGKDNPDETLRLVWQEPRSAGEDFPHDPTLAGFLQWIEEEQHQVLADLTLYVHTTSGPVLPESF